MRRVLHAIAVLALVGHAASAGSCSWTNATIPKDMKPEDLTDAQAIELIDARVAKGPAKKKKAAPKKKAPAKKKAAPKKAAAKKKPAAKKAKAD